MSTKLFTKTHTFVIDMPAHNSRVVRV